MQQPQPQPQPQPQQKGSISPFLAPLPTEKKKGQQLRLDLPKGSTTSAFSAQSTPRTAAGGTSAESPRGDVLSPKEPVASAPMVANATSAQKPGFQKPKTRSNTLYADAKTDKETVGKKVRTTLGNSARVIKTRLQSPGYYQRNTDDDYGDEYDENVSVSDASDNITDSSVVPRPPPIKIPTPQQTQQSQQQSQPEKKVVIQEDSNMELSSAVADEYYGGPGNDEVYSTGSEYNETSLLKSSIHQPEVTEPIPHLQPVMSTKMAADVKDSENALKARRGKAVSMSMMNFPKPENPQSLPEPGETPGGGSWKEYPLSRKFSVGNSIEYYSYIPDNASDVSNNSNNSNNNNMKFEPPSPGGGGGGGGGGGTARGGSGGSSSGSSTLRSVIHDFLNFESYENEDVERKTTKILKKRYILGNLLGRGSFAKVKEAYDLKLHKIVAIKIFNVKKKTYATHTHNTHTYIHNAYYTF